MKLENQVAIVVGLGTIGKTIATTFAAEGANIAVVDIIKMKPQLDTIAEKIVQNGREALTIMADATDEKQVNDMAEQVVRKWGKIDILVNSAGYRGPMLPVQEIGDGEWDKILNINLKAPFLCCKAALKQMIKQRSGNIVSISGTGGKEGITLRGPLCAAKWGLIGLTRVIAREAGPYGIRANAICPTGVMDEHLESMMNERAKALGVTLKDVEKTFLSKKPLGRFVQPDGVARAALFLASDDSSHTTGEALNVSAGEIMY